MLAGIRQLRSHYNEGATRSEGREGANGDGDGDGVGAERERGRRRENEGKAGTGTERGLKRGQ